MFILYSSAKDKRIKMFKIVFIVSLLSLSSFANSLQDDIAKLHSAPPNQRYKIMNRIKLQLSKMNAKQRTQTIQKLFKAIKTKQHIHHKNCNSKHIMMKKEKIISKMINLHKDYDKMYNHNNKNNQNKMIKNKHQNQNFNNKFKNKKNNHLKKNQNKNFMHKGR